MASQQSTEYGARLRSLRISTGMTMAELAAAAGGCSGRHLQMVETLGRRPSPELAARLCTILSERTGRVVKPSEIHDGGGRTRTSPAA